MARTIQGKSTVIQALYQLQSDSLRDLVRHGAHRMAISIDLADVQQNNLPTTTNIHGLVAKGNPFEARVHMSVEGGGALREVEILGRGGRAPFEPLPSVQPTNFIVPYLSTRRAASLSEQVSEPHALAVTGSHDFLYARIDRVYGSKALRIEYEQACEAVLGMIPTPFHTPNGKAAGLEIDAIARTYIRIPSMGAGVVNAVGLIVDLVTARRKLFLIEELENDMHPGALRALLRLIEAGVERDNQFVISTHSNVVVRSFGALEETSVTEVIRRHPDPLPTSSAKLVPSDAATRIDLLRKLGYELADSEYYEAWILFEESSAERIVRDFLIPWYVPGLQGRARTIAAEGVEDVPVRLRDLQRLMVFLHLQPIYDKRVWVIVDGDKAGRSIIEALRGEFGSWPHDHFLPLSKADFEYHYPERFHERVVHVLSLEDRRQRRLEKRLLLHDVLEWLRVDRSARHCLEESCAEVIGVLRAIEGRLREKS